MFSWEFYKRFLQNWLKRNTYEKLLLELLNILIRTITFTAKTWQTITEISVICIIRINVPRLHIYFCDSSTQSFRSAIVNNSCFLSLDSFYVHWACDVCLLMRQLITFIPEWDENSSFLFTCPNRQTWVTLLYILVHANNN